MGTIYGCVADAGPPAVRSPRVPAQPLGEADRAIRLTERFVVCCNDRRSADHAARDLQSLLLQRVSHTAFGYDDPIDDDRRQQDPMRAVLAGGLKACRTALAPLAGEPTLKWLELRREVASDASKQPRPRDHRGAVRRLVSRLRGATLHDHQARRFIHRHYDSQR